MSPTQRTLAYYKKLGYDVQDTTVERWIPNPRHPGGGHRKDYLGIIDIQILDVERGVVMGIQSTGSDFSGHFKKITGKGKEDEETRERLRQNAIDYISIPCHELILIGWRKIKKKRGGKAMVWAPRIHLFTISDFE